MTSVRDHCLSFVSWPLNYLSFCKRSLFVFCMLAVELPVILLEIIVCLLYVGRCTACHSVRDHCLSFVCCKKDKQWSLTEWQAVQRPTYKRKTKTINLLPSAKENNFFWILYMYSFCFFCWYKCYANQSFEIIIMYKRYS
jgi:hypothetical protein